MRCCAILIPLLLFSIGMPAAAGESLRVGSFNVDATPPLGSPVAYAPTTKILDPLTARGVVILGAGKPIVLCAVDWIGIANQSQNAWREQLAKAAGTTADRVTVHALHQHDGARSDFTSEALLAERGLGGKYHNIGFERKTMAAAAAAVARAVKESQRVTHLGVGKAKVEKVASNRRLLGPDGKLKTMRWSKSTNPDAIAAPEGVIDPYLQSISFWNGEKPLAVLTYYATHPQSYYGKGEVTSEFVGLARAMREKALPGVPHVHFNGASGNVAAGKYNDGSKRLRPILAQRMAAGMKAAWAATKKTPITGRDVRWQVAPVQLPPAPHLKREALLKILDGEDNTSDRRLYAAKHLAWLQRCAVGEKIEVSCLSLGKAHLLHLPGELFVEYQLAAQKMRPQENVCMAAYGDYGPGYIGTEIAYGQGGYETSERASRVAPSVEPVLMKALEKLLK